MITHKSKVSSITIVKVVKHLSTTVYLKDSNDKQYNYTSITEANKLSDSTKFYKIDYFNYFGMLKYSEIKDSIK